VTQIDTLRAQLLEAYIARDTADERVKALRNLIAGVSLGQQIEREAQPVPGPTAEPETQSVPAPQ